jgi:hypothetical protein
LLSHAKNPKHIHRGKLFNNEIQTVEENFTKQNAIVDVTKVAQIQRLVNTFHYMVKSNTQFENLCVLQLANGADLGEKYSSDKALGEFLTSLHSENICHVQSSVESFIFRVESSSSHLAFVSSRVRVNIFSSRVESRVAAPPWTFPPKYFF